MPFRAPVVFVFLFLPVAAPLAAQAHDSSHDHAAMHGSDTAFAAMQERGRSAMGVDQYSSVHRFDALPDGGRIVLQRDASDTAGVRTIRAHLKLIASHFAGGDFSIPGFVHAEAVPGSDVMQARRATIRYRFAPLPGGGAVRITTTDPPSIRAVHRFLAFQRSEHHASGNAL